MAKRKEKYETQVRRSQVVTTYGPGAMMDLPDESIIVSGLDQWVGVTEEVHEPRLLRKVEQTLQVEGLMMKAPPRDQGELFGPTPRITGWKFPLWLVTQTVDTWKNEKGQTLRSRRLVHRSTVGDRGFEDDDRRIHKVVPVRFVRACRVGHIGDIDWIAFVHGEGARCNRGLWLDDLGSSGDIADIQVRCNCGKVRRLKEAVATTDGEQKGALGLCDGSRPWLGMGATEQCNQPNRLLIRTASNTYFPVKLTVISLPKRNKHVSDAVEQAWPFLEAVENAAEVRYERRKASVAEILKGISDDEVWEAIANRRNPDENDDTQLKQDELKTLIHAPEESSSEPPDTDFHATVWPRSHWDTPWMESIAQVVLVHRLREVVAQVGFTRFESVSTDVDGELELGVKPAMLAGDLKWVPAIENRGEGMFLRFENSAIEQWATRKDVQRYGNTLSGGFDAWKEAHSRAKRKFPGLPYYLLHSLSHMLISQISLDCGYPASSIRERIYCFPDVGHGILLYTGSPDAEGTLGGLVQEGRRMDYHLLAALQRAELCSNDPVCAQHHADDVHTQLPLHGAACHGCLLIPETCCEQGNSFLDRSLVVGTVENRGVEFFPHA